jgi:hypothetical protein
VPCSHRRPTDRFANSRQPAGWACLSDVQPGDRHQPLIPLKSRRTESSHRTPSPLQTHHSRPTLQYERPQPPQRIGFFSKCNPRATPRSTLRKAVTYALVAAALWLIAAYRKPALLAEWQFMLPMWVGIAALVGAVCEWQVCVDGMDTTDYVQRLERHFGVVIGDAAGARLATLDDLCRHIVQLCHGLESPLSDDAIWTAVRDITSDEFGIHAGELHPGIRFVEDLNC